MFLVRLPRQYVEAIDRLVRYPNGRPSLGGTRSSGKKEWEKR